MGRDYDDRYESRGNRFGGKRRYGYSVNDAPDDEYRSRRRRSSSDDYDYSRSKRQRRHYSREETKEPSKEQILKRLKAILVCVGDRIEKGQESTGLQRDVQDLATTVTRDLSTYRLQITMLIVACAAQLPTKTSVYSALASLLNQKNGEVGAKIIQETLKQLKRDYYQLFPHLEEDIMEEEEASFLKELYMDRKNDTTALCLRVRLLVRFLGELVHVNMIVAEDYGFYLDTLLSCCFIQQDDMKVSHGTMKLIVLKDFICRVVMESMLYTGEALYKKCESVYHSLYTRCEEYMEARQSNRDIMEHWMAVHQFWVEEDATTDPNPTDRLEVLWDIILTIKKDANWSIPILSKPYSYDHFHTDESTTVHSLATPDLGSTFCIENIALIPFDHVYHLYDKDSGDQANALAERLSKIDMYVMRVYFEDIITSFHPKVTETGRQLITTCRSLNSKFNTPTEDNSDIKVEYLMVETIMMQMFQLPSPRYHRLFYYGVISTLIKTDARMISPVVAIVVELLFRKVADHQLDISVVDRFSEWFSYFLSHFDFKWPWNRWEFIVEDGIQEDDPQVVFLSNVIERCCRLSYFENIEKLLPSQFHSLLPPPATYCIRFHQEEAEEKEKELYEIMLALLKDRKDSSELQDWIREQQDTNHHAESLILSIVTTAILQSGAATFSHIRLLLEKYQHVFKIMYNSESQQVAIIEVLNEVWINSPQHIGIIMEVLLQHEIVQMESLLQWAFNDDSVQQFSWPYIWQVIYRAMNKTDHYSKEYFNELLVLVFQKFMEVLTQHKLRCQNDGIEYRDNWFLSTFGRMKEFGRMFHTEIGESYSWIETKLIDEQPNADYDPEIQNVFEQIKKFAI